MAWYGMTRRERERSVCLRGGREEEREKGKGTFVRSHRLVLRLVLKNFSRVLLELEVVVMWWWWCTMMINRGGGALCTLTKRIDITC